MTASVAADAVIRWLIAGDEAIGELRVRSVSRTDLVVRARSGDPEAFETLIRAAGDHLLAVARKILRDPDAAEDALQQAVIRAWRRLPQLRDPDKFDRWLYRILVMACYAEANRSLRFRSHVRKISTAEVGRDIAATLADHEALSRRSSSSLRRTARWSSSTTLRDCRSWRSRGLSA
jgi:RNA polymerase sigma factor (sigma-70 family)